LCRRLNRRREVLMQRVNARESQVARNPNIRPTTALQQVVRIRRKKGWLDLKRMALRLLQIGLWIGCLYFSVGLFPHSRWLQPVLL
ncbi:hypothetical protein, partial [Haemophilus parainfluenzae]|uniref:hypothetical protein n=1 Tax=Haemophilus parainfluenzae TaxID=729 RepID=UPI001CEC9F11